MFAAAGKMIVRSPAVTVLSAPKSRTAPAAVVRVVMAVAQVVQVDLVVAVAEVLAQAVLVILVGTVQLKVLQVVFQ